MPLTLFNHAWPLAFYFLFAYWTEFQQATSLHPLSIYAHIHKKHHKYYNAVSFAAESAHPLEHLIANVLPIMLPLAPKGTHFLSLFIFSIFELLEAAADHSGYDFLKLPPTELHDLHHSKFRVLSALWTGFTGQRCRRK